MDTPQALKSITVAIAGRVYPLKVTAAEETLIRQVAEEADAKVSAFLAEYPDKDRQDCLSMTLLTYAVEAHRAKARERATLPSDALHTRLSDIEVLLDKALG